MLFKHAPFLRLLPALIAGILLGIYLPAAVALLGGLIVGLASVGYGGFLHYKGIATQKAAIAWAVAANLFLASLGLLSCYLQRPQNQPSHLSSLPADTAIQYRAWVNQPPVFKPNTVRVSLTVEAAEQGGIWQPITGQLSATFALDTVSAGLGYGQSLLISSQLRPISAPLNPHGLDLRNYYAIQGIYHQTYIASGQFLPLGESQSASGTMGAIYRLRGRLVEVFRQHCPTDNEYAVASALILGVRADVSQEISNAYADTGAMHVLSVSGLHVGMIAWVLVWLFGLFSIKAKSWEYTKLGLVLGLIWLFAIMTGATPPAIRSAAMFSFVSAGQILTRKANIYNSLASSAFFLLLYNPLWLLDVGFQLSYLALWGIVFYQPRIYKLLYTPVKLLDWAWNLTSVSIAATISTLPISLYYFGQFSLSSFLSGLVVIPISTLILPLGFLLIFVHSIPILGTWIGYGFHGLLFILNGSVFAMQGLPYSVIESVFIHLSDMWLLYAGVGLATWAFWVRNLRYMLYAMGCLLLVLLHRAVDYHQAETQTELCFYHLNKSQPVALIQGRQMYTLADSNEVGGNKLDFLQKGHLRARRIAHNRLINRQENFENSQLTVKKSLVLFHNQLIGFYPAMAEEVEDCAPTLNWVVVEPPSKYRLIQLEMLQPSPSVLLISGKNGYKSAEFWQDWAQEQGWEYQLLSQQGAYLRSL